MEANLSGERLDRVLAEKTHPSPLNKTESLLHPKGSRSTDARAMPSQCRVCTRMFGAYGASSGRLPEYHLPNWGLRVVAVLVERLPERKDQRRDRPLEASVSVEAALSCVLSLLPERPA